MWLSRAINTKKEMIEPVQPRRDKSVHRGAKRSSGKCSVFTPRQSDNLRRSLDVRVAEETVALHRKVERSSKTAASHGWRSADGASSAQDRREKFQARWIPHCSSRRQDDFSRMLRSSEIRDLAEERQPVGQSARFIMRARPNWGL